MLKGAFLNEEEVLPEDHLEIPNIGIIKNLSSLIEVLRIMDEEIFSHYVSESQNLFSDWLSDEYNKKEIAKKIQNIRNRSKTIKILEKELRKEELLRNKERIKRIVSPKNKKEILMELNKLEDGKSN